MVSSDCSNEYWFVVEECLVKFHHIDPLTARREIQGVKNRLKQGKTINNLIFHVEPFELACDIGKKDLCLDEYWNEYEKMLQSYTPRKARTSPPKKKKESVESNVRSIGGRSRAGTTRRGGQVVARKVAAKKAAAPRKKTTKKAAASKKKTTRK